jgi:uncharacterized protein DUF6932
MSLPEFNANGLFPDGIHRASMDELRERCVDAFHGSGTRPDIFATFIRYRQTLENLGLSLTQWIDGSFVDQTRLNPGDIDLVNFCESELYRKLSRENHERAMPLLGDGHAPGFEGKIHCFLVMRFDDDMGGGFPAASEIARKECRDWFSQPMDYSRMPKKAAAQRGRKGIVQITLGDVKLCPKVDD